VNSPKALKPVLIPGSHCWRKECLEKEKPDYGPDKSAEPEPDEVVVHRQHSYRQPNLTTPGPSPASGRRTSSGWRGGESGRREGAISQSMRARFALRNRHGSVTLNLRNVGNNRTLV